ncbi:MAG: pilus assembly protein [Thermosipho sp. (in: Bacteria)]|nr:pilus assembly protein [Thermosipho sp. (in: thermotogales)]
MKYFIKDAKGSAIVEVSIMLPIVLALVFGSIMFIQAQRTQIVLDMAAREAARDFAKTDSVSRAILKAEEELRIGGIDPDKTRITPIRNGYERQVKIEISYPLMIPFVGKIDPKLTGHSTFHVESSTVYW